MAVVEGPVACVGHPACSIGDIEHRIGGRACRRGGCLGRTGCEIEPCDLRCALVVGQSVTVARCVVEDDDAIGIVRIQLVAAVDVAVCQRETHLRPWAEVDRVESFQPCATFDAVVGGVAQVVFESDIDTCRWHESDFAVFHPEASAVVGQFRNRLAVGIERLRSGRLDDVAYCVVDCRRVGIDAAGRAGLCRHGGQAAGIESHAGRSCRRVVRCVSAAHVERSEEIRLQEPAFDAVSRFFENGRKKRSDVQERSVIVDRKHPFDRQQIRGIACAWIFVAVHRKETYGCVVRPTVEDGRGGQRCLVVDCERVELGECGLLRPIGSAVAQFEDVFRLRCREQPCRTCEEQGSVGCDFGRVDRLVESCCSVRVAGEAGNGIVCVGYGKRHFQRPARAAGIHIGQRGDIVLRELRQSVAEVATVVVDGQFHGRRDWVFGRMMISM